MRRFLPAPLILLALTACASGSFGRVSDELIIFPTPPDTARIQFLLTVSGERDVKGVRTGFFAELLEEASTQALISKPYGVDLFHDRFYICDSMLPGVVVIDAARQRLEQWQPRSLGELQKPINCAVDRATGNLYVADTERRQVVVFDSTRSYVGAFGEGDGTPADVYVAGERLWVADIENGRVRAYDKATFTPLASFPEPEEDGTRLLKQPTNLWVQDGYVYVSDFGDFNVKVFTEDGELVRTLGSFGRALGQFTRPKGIAVDRDGLIYVVDSGFENVQVFDPEGRLLLFFGGPYEGPGTMWLPAKVRIVYEGIDFFRDYVDPRYDLQYLVLVTNQYGPDRLNVYGFVKPISPAGPVGGGG